MRRYLVVANRTLGGGHLLAKVRECLAVGPSEFHVLVPCVPSDQGPHLTGELTGRRRGPPAEALARFRAAGATVTGEVGDAAPLEAMRDVMRRQQFDEIILSTLPPGVSRWLGQDLPHRVEKQFKLSLHHVVAL